MEDSNLKNNNVMNPGKALLLLFAVIFAGFIASQIGAAFAFIPFMDLSDIGSIEEKLSNLTAYPEMRLPLLLSQGVSSLILFIITPLVYIKFVKIDGDELLGYKNIISPKLILTSILVTIVAFPLISAIYEWNMSWNIPGTFGEWARLQEEQLKVVTEFLLNIDSIPQLALTFIIVAVIAGVGEELLFRGLIQTHLGFAINNPHVVIWITAILFGVFHLQFFGVVPRILLGALMGYLFYWSGSIKYSMIAHITNNGFQVLASYFLAQSEMNVNMDEEITFPVYITIISMVITGSLLYFFYHHFYKNEVADRI